MIVKTYIHMFYRPPLRCNQLDRNKYIRHFCWCSDCCHSNHLQLILSIRQYLLTNNYYFKSSKHVRFRYKI